MFTRRSFLLPLTVLFLSLLVVPVYASFSVVEGPDLSYASGYLNCGLFILAKADVSLVSVGFPNEGYEDVILLYRVFPDWVLLDSITVAAGNTNATVEINYPLTAGEMYLLVATTPNNKYFGIPASFPTGNQDIAVVGSYLGVEANDWVWFAFNNITTSPTTVDLMAVIDIKPGSDDNTINLKSKGVVPVAILTSEDFDATNVDLAGITFAGAYPAHIQFEDIDYDGDYDLLLHFRTEELTDLTANSTEAVLTGATLDGISFTGTDAVKIIPRK